MSNSRSGVERATWWQAALLIRGQTATDQRNIGAIWVWTLVWVAALLAVMIALVRFPEIRGPFAWLLALVPIVIGIQMVRTFVRLLRDADEFMRKIQLEGIAVGYGAGIVFCLGYSLLEHLGAPRLPMVFAAVPLAFGWALGSFFVAARYR